MDVKLVLLAFVALLITLVQADFFYNPPRLTELDPDSDLKCLPGRTIISIAKKTDEIQDSSEEFSGRRSHMNGPKSDDESCRVCVCSVEGKDEYCSNRPARNVNECIRMAMLKERFNRNIPYDIKRTLAYRIRRDYIWHNDEIPYEAKAKCRRGTSYYSNSITANDTDIDVASDVESLLDYSNKDICFYCVCTVEGHGVGCISRDPWYCNYFRMIRDPDYPRDRYAQIFKQDRPSYFRQISYRLRRTMDDGMFSMMQSVGDDSKSATCIPFVSEYTDCTDENRCSGCNICKCNANSQWVCQPTTECLGMSSFDLDENSVDRAWESIEGAWKKNAREVSGQSKSPYAPRPTGSENDMLLDEIANLEKVEQDEDEELINSDLLGLLRRKRSIPLPKEISNDTVQFYHTTDEMNIDTLKNNDTFGTVEANKIKPNRLPQISRRNGVFDITNISNPLHIEYKSPLYDHHIADNKIDTPSHDLLDRDKVNKVMGNQTQQNKDKNLSKLIVNELKKGIEVVGDANAPSISNITFIRQNDTLTAMAFIAGNLLNKLWNMEKDERDSSIETDMMKHEKIADLLELFKEPLTIRQENFLKNALEHLSEAIDGNKDASNISLCKEVETLKGQNGTTQKELANKENCREASKVTKLENLKSTEDALAKLNNVLGLLSKYETIQKNISNRKYTPSVKVGSLNDKPLKRSRGNSDNQYLTDDESTSLNLYGNILKKITKLLVPKRKGKKLVKTLNNKNILLKSDDLKTKLKRIYNIDLENTTLSTKDRVILDYLSNLRDECCHLNQDKLQDLPSIEGDILLNLSEFFKVKSFVDLLKLLEPEKSPITRDTGSSRETTVNAITESVTTASVVESDPVDKLSKAKENLKAHLKIIINDLLELKNDSNVKIADALPCIYNLLNADKDLAKISKIKQQKFPLDNIKKMFELIKKDMKYSTPTRRTLSAEKRPKSAVVWERVIRNLDTRPQLNTRRYLKTKSFEELNNMMEDLESTSNTYKNQLLMKEVSPSKRLVLLKALDVNVKQYVNVLEELKTYIDTVINVTSDHTSDINEFVENAARNMKLNEKVLIRLKKPSEVEQLLTRIPNYKVSENKLRVNEPLITQTSVVDKSKLRSKLSREEIINQLIKNRIQYYLKVKDAGDVDSDNDMNVRIAKKILHYLNSNNNNLARELYKIFVSRKQPSRFDVVSSHKAVAVTTPRNYMMAVKEPLLQFESRRMLSNEMKPAQEMLLKQLLNIKNMKI